MIGNWHYLGEVWLKSKHRAYAYHDGTCYKVDTYSLYDSDLISKTWEVSEGSVQQTRTILARWGRQSIAQIASRVKFLGAFDLGFVYDDGQMLEQEVERALIVLIAKREADVKQNRRPMVFWTP